jgi:hypothetical protein
MKLTPHFSLEEMIASQEATRQGIDNTPPDNVFLNLIKLCNTLEKIRTLLDAPVVVSSGYRSPPVNKAIGGGTASHHMIGLACDFISPSFGSPLDVCNKIRESDIEYDQLIHEFGRWVHIGLDNKPRQQNLTATKDSEGKTVYSFGHF